MQASFVIATYGRPEVLAATLGALVLQRQPDWEAIVVGDC
ncbi:MAG: glycosyltransferase family 2 protein [Actinomycetota bacterium]